MRLKVLTLRICAYFLLAAFFIPMIPGYLFQTSSATNTRDMRSAEYNFYSCLAVNENVRPLTDYNEEKNTNWKFKQHFNETSNVKRYSSAATIRMTSTSASGWTAFIIKAPADGVYQASMTYLLHSGAKTAAVYLLPADSDLTDINTLLAGKIPVGNINYLYQADIGNDVQNVILGEVELRGADEYMLLMRCIERNPESDSAGGGTMHISTFSLRDADAAKLKTLEYRLGMGTVTVGQSTESIPSAFLGDGSPLNLSPTGNASVSYVSSAPNIASVDPDTGRVTGESPGNATITVTVALGDKTLSESADITVIPPLSYPGDEATTVFNFTEGLKRSGESILPLTEYDPNKNKNWAFYAADRESIIARSYYETLRIYGSTLDNWIALRINVPDAGRYNSWISYRLHVGCVSANAYILPGDVPSESISALINERQPVGVIQYKASTTVDRTRLGTIDIPVSGDYLLVLRAKELSPTTGGAGRGGIHISSLTLDGVAPTPLDSVKLSLTSDTVAANYPTTASVTGTLVGGVEADISPDNLGVISYSSSNPEIVTVDQDGIICAVSKGLATIRVSVTLDGITKTDELEVYSVDYNGSDSDMAFEFSKNLEEGAAVHLLTEFNPDTNPNWFYVGNYLNRPGYANVQAGTVRLTAADSDAWSAFGIQSEHTGLFSGTLQFENHSGAKKASIYLLPGDTEYSQIDSSIISLSPIATYDMSTNPGLQTVAIGEYLMVEGRNYIIILQVAEPGTNHTAGIGTLSVSSIYLSGNPAVEEPQVIESIEFNVEKSPAAIGAKVKTLLSGLLTSGKKADLSSTSAAEIVYHSSDPTVAKIDATGLITCISDGSSELNVSVTLGGVTVEASAPITIIPSQTEHSYPGSEATIVYDFVTCLARTGEYVNDLTDYNLNKNTNWAFAKYFTDEVNRIRSYYGALRLSATSANAWTAFRIKSPAPGRYKARMTYQRHIGAASADIFLLPGVIPVDSIGSELSSATPIGTVEYEQSDEVRPRTVILNEVDLSGQTDYYLVLKVNQPSPVPVSAGSGTIHISEFILDGSQPLEDLTASIDGVKNHGQLELGIAKRIIVSTPNKTDDIENSEVSFNSLNDDIATVTQDGTVTAHGVGVATIEIIANMGEFSNTILFSVVCGSTKNRRSFYNDELVANARENIERYKWAETIKNVAVREADKHVGRENELWNMVTSQGLPRSSQVGVRLHPKSDYCPYCDTNITTKYGTFPWLGDAYTRPWKIQCPDCRRSFPSNDFSGYYQLGLDEHREFNRALAIEKNNALIAEHKDGYLKNTLYPEKGEGWAVDDGWGDADGRTYISYYNHHMLWGYGTPVNSGGVLQRALNSLGDAYLYTGEEKYGRTGAILLDRIADVFPEMDLDDYPEFFHTDGGSRRGKILGCIQDYNLTRRLAENTDKLWPAQSDPYVIDFLSRKAAEYNIDNPKTNEQMIRINSDNGILREINIAVRDARVHGGWGNLRALATAAITLDTLPETKEWIDFIFQPGERVTTRLFTGGDIYGRLMDEVCRDGHGKNGAPGYNALWIVNLATIADGLYGYDKYEMSNLYLHPKVQRMLTGYYELIVANRYVPIIGDTGQYGRPMLFSATGTLINAIQAGAGTDDMIRYLYLLGKEDLSSLYAGIFTKDPEKIQDDIREMLKDSPSFQLPSMNLAGFGFMILRDGVLLEGSGGNNNIDTQRALWIYHGRNMGHGHRDKLNLGVYSFGLDLTPDNGNPLIKTVEAHRIQWVNNPLAHNTVLVDQGLPGQRDSIVSTPLHFDDSKMVKVMDVDAPEAYNSANIFRRTVVSVNVDDNISYGVDFFRIKGGNDHIYAFNAQSNEVEVIGEELVKQVDETGKYVGTYAGKTIPFGPDPKTNLTDTSTPLMFPTGYTWMKNVEKSIAPAAPQIIADFKITDFFNALPGSRNIHLRLTMLNDADRDDSALSEFSVVSSQPPQHKGTPTEIRQILARRSGTNLDTLYTTVIEPYEDNNYISSVTSVGIVDIEGIVRRDDAARAIKVTLEDGREDYIVYATNNTVRYMVDDKFEFRGFIGVFSEKDGKMVLSYLNDGDVIGEISGIPSRITGNVVDFTREFTTDNRITIRTNDNVDPGQLAGKYIYIDNGGYGGGEYNGCLPIEHAERNGDLITLHLGNTTLIVDYKNQNDASNGYTYLIEHGQSFNIPLSFITDNAPVFEPIRNYIVDANSEIRFTVSATSPVDKPLSYSAPVLPRGAQFNNESATFTWRPEANQAGTHPISFRVTDGSLTANQETLIRVLSATSRPSRPTLEENGDSGGTGGSASPGGGGTPSPGGGTLTPTPTKRFIDLAGFDWARSAIEQLADTDIIKGTGHNTYSPGANIKRGDFVLLMARAFELKGESSDGFSDVPADAYYKEALAAAKEIGIITGVGDNKFNPTEEISRQDIMVIVKRLLDYLKIELKAADDKALSAYTDSSEIADYAKDAVSTLIANEIITGANNRINPRGNAIRAEIAVILMRVMEKAL